MNFYKLIPKEKQQIRNTGYDVHGLDLPHYAIVVAASGGGKTNLLLNFLKLSDGSFQRIVICCKNSDEPLYNLLKKKNKDIEFYENGEIPDLDSFEEYKSSFIAFDDLVLEKDQRKIENYYIRARKLGITCWYLTQSFYRTPKLIRINARYVFIKKLTSLKDLKMILREYSMEDDLNDVLKLYNEATKNFTDFLLIDTQNNKFTKNFKE